MNAYTGALCSKHLQLLLQSLAQISQGMVGKRTIHVVEKVCCCIFAHQMDGGTILTTTQRIWPQNLGTILEKETPPILSSSRKKQGGA